MITVSTHSKERIIERVSGIDTVAEAKKTAKQAWASGKTIKAYENFPKFFSYLRNKKNQTNSCSIRIYKDNIYIWKGKNHTLVTAHPIPDKYMEELYA